MRTAINGAGRIVGPKSVRDAMGLTAGTAIDVVFTDERLAIEVAPASVTVVDGDELPQIVPREELGKLTDQRVRDALDATRR